MTIGQARGASSKQHQERPSCRTATDDPCFFLGGKPHNWISPGMTGLLQSRQNHTFTLFPTPPSDATSPTHSSVSSHGMLG